MKIIKTIYYIYYHFLDRVNPNEDQQNYSEASSS